MTSRARVLIVDDDPAICKLFSRVLKRAGFDAPNVKTGSAALESIAAVRPAVVLLDSRMPAPDGIEVLRLLRSDPETCTLPVILVTGLADMDDRVAGLDAGADDYLTKPVDPTELVARVRAQVRGDLAWRAVVEQIWRERARVLEQLTGIANDPLIADPAEAACDAIVTLRGVGSCAVLEMYDGTPHTLARSGPINWEVGRSLPEPTGIEIARRSRRGPWGWDNAGPRGNQQHITSAFSPILRNGALVGILVLTSDPSDPSSASGIPAGQTLATAIELAPAIAELLAVRNATGIDLVASRAELVDIIENERFHPVFQPIARIADGTLVGYEALTRFDDDRAPAKWFADSTTVDDGIDLDLEIATLRSVLAVAGALPPEAFLSLNASARLIVEVDRLRSVLDLAPERTVVLELTEREPVNDYNGLKQALRSFPGVHIAVDDAGAGYSSLRHILAIEPHFIKLDHLWVKGLEDDAARQALLSGLAHFAAITGGEIIAEGIETESERDAVTAAGATLGQGYFFGKPSPVETWA